MKRNTLPDVVDSPDVEDGALVLVLAVHIHFIRLAPALIGKDVEICAKYGAPMASVQCTTAPALVKVNRPAGAAFSAAARRRCEQPHPALAEINATCLFLEDPEREPIMRLRLRRPGIWGRTIAKACVAVRKTPLACLEYEENQEVPLIAVDERCCEALGEICVTVKMRELPVGTLRELLPKLGCQRQRHALLRSLAPIKVGELVPAATLPSAADVLIVRGEAAEEMDPEATKRLPVSQVLLRRGRRQPGSVML